MPEGIFIVNVEGLVSSKPKEKVLTFTSASMLSPNFPLLRYALATHAALASLRAPPDFDILQDFQPQDHYELWWRHSSLLSSVIVHCVNTMPMVWYLC